MKNNFFLKARYFEQIYGNIGLFIGSVAFTLYITFYIRFHYILLIFNVFSFISIFLALKHDKVCGLYINGSAMYFKGTIFTHDIRISSIECIRIFPETARQGLTNTWQPVKDESGNIQFLMSFNHGYYAKDEEDGNEFIEEIKRSFKEKRLCSCVFDQEAIDYLLTLNPNIKVIYYKEGW